MMEWLILCSDTASAAVPGTGVLSDYAQSGGR